MKNIFIFFSNVQTIDTIKSIPGNYSAPRLLNSLISMDNSICIVFNGNIKRKEEYRNCKLYPIKIRYILKVIKKYNRYDRKFIISNFQFYRYPLAFLLKILINGKLIYRTGGVFFGIKDINSKRFVRRNKKFWLYAKLADLIISTSDGTPVDEFMNRLKVPQKKYRHWLNGFPVIKNIGNYKRENNILCISRLSPEKNVDFVIRSFNEAKEKIDNKFKLVIVGDGIHKKELISLVEELGISDRVIFEGYSNNLSKYYYSSKLVITGFSNNTIIEGIVTNTPLITIDLGKTKNLYNSFPNVFIIPYAPGGLSEIDNKHKLRLIKHTSALIIEILTDFQIENYKNNIDYKKYGWEQRIKKEIQSYFELYN